MRSGDVVVFVIEIPDGLRLRLPVLLSAGECTVGRRVRGPDDQDIVVRPQSIGNVSRERNVAAPMNRNLLAVHPNTGLVVDRAEVEKDAPRAPGFRNPERPAAPDHIVKRGVGDPAPLALKAKRNLDDAVGGARAGVPALRETTVGIVEFELPASVE